MRLTILAAAALALTGATAETPDQIAARLSREGPVARRLIARYPAMKTAWREDFWADALLRAPRLPGTRWRIHDLNRPQPRIVRPPLTNCAGPPPPRQAMILFDGHGTTAFTGEKLALWQAGDTLVAAARAGEGNRIATRARFGAVRLHLEYRAPAPARGVFQYRGNSGVFLMQRYEVQILDSFDNPTYPDGQAAALYGQVPPRVNASLPPGRWQCLDIRFEPPRFAGDRLARPARISVWHNRVLVQDRTAFLGPTAFARILPYTPHPDRLPIEVQDHGDGTSQVAFRNIWALPLEDRAR